MALKRVGLSSRREEPDRRREEGGMMERGKEGEVGQELEGLLGTGQVLFKDDMLGE